MNIKPIAFTQEFIRHRYLYDETDPLALRWNNPPVGRVRGEIAGHWVGCHDGVRRRRVYVHNNRTTPAAWAVWVYIRGTQPPPYLRTRPDNPEDFRIENLIVVPRPKQSPEERKASNAEFARRWRARFTPEELRSRQRSHNVRNLYGLTLETYEAMLASQNGACAICGGFETVTMRAQSIPLGVDHCHASGKVRGLLCQHCNNGLGRFVDSPDILRAAADYLERSAIADDAPRTAWERQKVRRERRNICREGRLPRWRVRMRIGGELTDFGAYDSFEEAVKVRDAAEAKKHAGR